MKKLISVVFPLLIATILGIVLGWWFNAAYFSALGDSARATVRFLSVSSLSYGADIVPYTERVFQSYAVIQIAAALVCLALSLRFAKLSRRTRVAVLLGGACLPLLFYATASLTRLLTEKGVLGVAVAGITPPSLTEGQSFMLAEYKFTKVSSGLAVENIIDSRSVRAILFDHAESFWVNHGLLTVVAALLFAALVVRFVQAVAKGETP